MPCSTRCNNAPRSAAVIATKSCCGVRGASIDTFMLISEVRSGASPELATPTPYPRGYIGSQNFFTFRDNRTDRSPKRQSPPIGGPLLFATNRGSRLADLAAPDGFEPPNA